MGRVIPEGPAARLVSELETFLRKVPGSGPYMETIRETIDESEWYGPHTFSVFLSVLSEEE